MTSSERYLSYPDQPPEPAERLNVALAGISDSLVRNRDFYMLLPANIVDALLGVARVAADQMAHTCICTRCAVPMARELTNLVEVSLPI